MKGIRWGLVGASDIAATRVVPAMRRLGHEISAVLSTSPERGRACAAANGIPWATTELDALPERHDLDAVYISTTNELHHPQILAAAVAVRQGRGRRLAGGTSRPGRGGSPTSRPARAPSSSAATSRRAGATSPSRMDALSSVPMGAFQSWSSG